MGATVGVNTMSVVHKDSSGVSPCFPDVCKTPAPNGTVPIPYPNVAKASDSAKGTKKVKLDGNPVCVKDSNFSTSTGDEAGKAGGGVASSKTKGKAEFVNYSFDVKLEGKGVARALDLMLHNGKNTPPFPVMQGPVVTLRSNETAKRTCAVCGEEY